MINNNLYKVLLSAHVSEKSSNLENSCGQYVFKVLPNASKKMIKDAVEKIFSVSVSSVRVCNVKGKVKRFGRKNGKRSDWKKAYVAVKEGKIDLMSSVN